MWKLFLCYQKVLSGRPVSRKYNLLSLVYLLFAFCCDCPWKNVYYENPEDTRLKILEIRNLWIVWFN